MELIFVRHGESEDNVGWTTREVQEARQESPPLTPLGMEQAKRSAELLEQEQDISAFFCSPQVRALQTATAIAKRTGLSPQVWIELSEKGFDHGVNGLPRSTIIARFPCVQLPPEIDEDGWGRWWNGETIDEHKARMEKVAARLLSWSEVDRYKKLLFIVHANSIRVLLNLLLGIRPEGFIDFVHNNCGITRLEIKPASATRLYCLNERGHLYGLPTNSRRKAPGQRASETAV